MQGGIVERLKVARRGFSMAERRRGSMSSPSAFPEALYFSLSRILVNVDAMNVTEALGDVVRYG